MLLYALKRHVTVDVINSRLLYDSYAEFYENQTDGRTKGGRGHNVMELGQNVRI
jgi:hypothetical protein